LSQRELNQIKLAYSLKQLDGWPAPLTDWISMQTVLVTGPTVKQNSPKFSN